MADPRDPFSPTQAVMGATPTPTPTDPSATPPTDLSALLPFIQMLMSRGGGGLGGQQDPLIQAQQTAQGLGLGQPSPIDPLAATRAMQLQIALQHPIGVNTSPGQALVSGLAPLLAGRMGIGQNLAAQQNQTNALKYVQALTGIANAQKGAQPKAPRIVQSGRFYRVTDPMTGEPIPDAQGRVDRELPKDPTTSDFLHWTTQTNNPDGSVTITNHQVPARNAMEAAQTGEAPKGIESTATKAPPSIPPATSATLTDKKYVINMLTDLEDKYAKAFPEGVSSEWTSGLRAQIARNAMLRKLDDYHALDPTQMFIGKVTPEMKRAADTYNSLLGSLRSLGIAVVEAKWIIDSLGNFDNPKQFPLALRTVINQRVDSYNTLVKGLVGKDTGPFKPIERVETPGVGGLMRGVDRTQGGSSTMQPPPGARTGDRVLGDDGVYYKVAPGGSLVPEYGTR